MDEDSELGDFNPQNDSSTEAQNDADEVPHPPQPGEEDPTKAANRPDPQPKGVPELRQRSEHDREIRPGDTVWDMFGSSWLIVLWKAADSVKEYDAAQPDTKKSLLDYEGSRCTGATEEDTVWQCFHLNRNNTLAGGRSGPYGFPESRIIRYAYESTDGFKGGRFQDHIQIQVLEQIARAAIEIDEQEAIREASNLMAEAFGSDMKDEAFELAEASGDLDG
jgi:hypothetical protein